MRVFSLVLVGFMSYWWTQLAGINSIVVSPDTLALASSDEGRFTAVCYNQYSDPIKCKGGIRWTVRDTSKVQRITTTAESAPVLAKVIGTTWVVARSAAGITDSGKVSVLTNPPIPIPPTPPESIFASFTVDTLDVDSAATGAASLRSYHDAARTVLITGRTMAVTSTNSAVATASPPSGSSTLALTIDGVTPGTARIIGTSSLPGERDTMVVVVHSVTDTTTPPDTTSIPPIACRAGAPAIVVGENWQTRINAFGTGQYFCVRAGVHRFASVQPKTNDTLVGETGAIMRGAKVLTGWTSDGAGHFYVGSQTQQGSFTTNIPCLPTKPGCNYPEQLWVDNHLYEHVTSLGAVATSKWYFDYAADRIYLPFNPADSLVETSVTQQAITAGGTGVVILGLTVEKYASAAQTATVNGSTSWRVLHNKVCDNHGLNIKVGNNGIIRGNEICRAGQLGVSASQSPGTPIILVDTNDIHHNNTAGFGGGVNVECGGSKFVRTENLIVRANDVHHNECNGLWTDIDNIAAKFVSNIVHDNKCNGIITEIDYQTIIDSNDVYNNGVGCTLGGVATSPAGIFIANTRDARVRHNIVHDNKNGITCFDDVRTDAPHALGSHDVVNLLAENNTVTQTDAGRAAGCHDGDASANPFAANNIWRNNTYHRTLGTTKWRWTGNADVSETTWRAAQDAGSTFAP